jgi:hypothetical protein
VGSFDMLLQCHTSIHRTQQQRARECDLESALHNQHPHAQTCRSRPKAALSVGCTYGNSGHLCPRYLRPARHIITPTDRHGEREKESVCAALREQQPPLSGSSKSGSDLRLQAPLSSADTTHRQHICLLNAPLTPTHTRRAPRAAERRIACVLCRGPALERISPSIQSSILRQRLHRTIGQGE